jgi:hypothetical protein
MPMMAATRRENVIANAWTSCLHAGQSVRGSDILELVQSARRSDIFEVYLYHHEML